MKFHVPDLTQHPPRSPRVRLGGYVILPRILDKGRAALAGLNGEYNYDCPTDRQFFDFAGIDAEALRQQLALGLGDGQILAWIQARSRTHPEPAQIAAWSAHQETRTPTTLEMRQFYQEEHQRIAPHREDLSTWFDLLDLDDFVSFGGIA
ncbi:MAG TPA: DUF5069 domain-containing protein [Candidatus Paceibacterota bacterium]|nr:DUF5069 domain-containing protein [Verrucomicrobiota bacterium]HOX03800.1 DUF5069 domain-containing protein [Verrucomicrobiota bacterium]HRZ46698.1 DUF5069 domain-containing protein [Candidatus Paceibacterota bacterium]HRZ94437.1 DUF5069 domain-containing protein [Candidatus Paceibacterota bacterium]